jgi:clan AA aspartic protease
VVDVDAVVDSGFTASLTLPTTAVAALGLVRQSGGGAVLADGSIQPFDIYAAEVDWDGSWRAVLVSAVGDEVLLGMRLLTGHELRIAVVPTGAVEIKPLP